MSGNYQGSFGGGIDTLTLRSDGTFCQQFVTGAGKVHTSARKWELTTSGSGPLDPDGNTTASFDKISLHAGHSGQQHKPKITSLSGAEVYTSSICFSTNPNDEQGDCSTRNGL